MKDISILQPVLALVLLNFLLFLWMGKERFEALQAKTVISPGPGQQPVWPERAAKASAAFHNILEMPVLFYAVVAFAMIASAVDYTMVLLAWAYVVFRIIQAAVHTTYNHIPHRFLAYLGSNIMLMAMWVKLAVVILAA